MGHEDLSVVGAVVVTTPIPEVLTYLLSPRRPQRPWPLQLELELDQWKALSRLRVASVCSTMRSRTLEMVFHFIARLSGSIPNW